MNSTARAASRWLLWSFISCLAVVGARPGGAVAQQTATILTAGWNNILYTGPTGPVQTMLNPIAGQLTAIVIWDATAQRWHSYFPNAPQSSDLQTLLSGQAYWISMQSPGLLPSGASNPAPEQVVSGWNNVAYFGPGAPGSSILEQNAVWTWDPNGQGWQHRDPNSLATSDFQSLTPYMVYWVYVSTPSSATPSSPPPVPAQHSSGCYPFNSLQPTTTDIDSTLVGAGMGTLQGDPQLAAPAERSGSGGSEPQAYVPSTLLRAIAWVESSWHQATYATPRGQSGPTLASTACAFGLMQIATGMSIGTTPSATQEEIGTDFHANVQDAVQLLVKNWNRDPSVLPYAGRHDPRILEDWYFATWAFHCFGSRCTGYGVHDNPDDPSLPWPRPAYNSPQQVASSTIWSLSDYPYQELVYGFVANPPTQYGQSLWQPIPVQLPTHGAVGYPQPASTGEPSAHLEDGSSLTPVTSPVGANAPPSVSASEGSTDGSPIVTKP